MDKECVNKQLALKLSWLHFLTTHCKRQLTSSVIIRSCCMRYCIRNEYAQKLRNVIC